MKHMTCLRRPAIAGIAALGLTTTALLAPAAHASSSAAERPDTFTSAYTASLVPLVTAPAEAPAPAEEPAAIEEERSSHVTPADPAASAQDEAVGAAGAADSPAGAVVATPADAPADAPAEAPAPVSPQGESSSDVPADGDASVSDDVSGDQGAVGAEAPIEPAADASVPGEDSGDATPAEAPADAAAEDDAAEEATAEDETTGEAAPADDLAPAQEQVTGDVMLQVNADRGMLCFDIGLAGVSADGSATIHLHDATGAERLAFPGQSGCLPTDVSTLAQIEANPAAFSVDVHTEQSPDGAARGYLTQVPLGGVDAGGGGTATQDSALPVAGAVATAVLLGLGGAFALSRRSRGSV